MFLAAKYIGTRVQLTFQFMNSKNFQQTLQYYMTNLKLNLTMYDILFCGSDRNKMLMVPITPF